MSIRRLIESAPRRETADNAAATIPHSRPTYKCADWARDEVANGPRQLQMRCQCGVEGYRGRRNISPLSSLTIVIRAVNANGILMPASDTYPKGPSARPIYGTTGL